MLSRSIVNFASVRKLKVVNAKPDLVESKSAFAWAPKGKIKQFLNRSQLKREYPLNLSILIRGGKETNKDSPSNGE